MQVFQESYGIKSEVEIEEYNPNYGILNIYIDLNTAILPDIAFKFKNKNLIMKPEDYLYSCHYNFDSD